MFNKVNNLPLSQKHLAVLSLFTHGFDVTYHGREITRLLSLSSRTSARLLQDLERQNMLVSEYRGKTKLYSLSRDSLSLYYLHMAEYFKTIQYFKNNPVIAELVGGITGHANGMVVIFGSRVSGDSSSDSDLDVLVIGTVDEHAVRKLGLKYGVEVDLKRYSFEQFQNRKSSDILLREVIKKHIVVRGVETFVTVCVWD